MSRFFKPRKDNKIWRFLGHLMSFVFGCERGKSNSKNLIVIGAHHLNAWSGMCNLASSGSEEQQRPALAFVLHTAPKRVTLHLFLSLKRHLREWEKDHGLVVIVVSALLVSSVSSSQKKQASTQTKMLLGMGVDNYRPFLSLLIVLFQTLFSLATSSLRVLTAVPKLTWLWSLVAATIMTVKAFGLYFM